MEPHEALRILDLATQPQAAGQLTRADYGNIELALQCLRAHLQPPAVPAEAPATPAACLADPAEALRSIHAEIHTAAS